MKRLDEDSIIRIFQKRLGNKKFVSDDVETMYFDGKKIFAKTDTLVQSTDIPPKMTLKDAARKSIVACVSDFAAKGIRPRYGIVSVNLPKPIIKSQIEEIAAGFKKASHEFGIDIIGGDTNEGKEIVFNVCIFGRSKKTITRKDSKVGDVIFVTGPFGYTSIGLEYLLNGIKNKMSGKSVNYVLKPKTRLDFGLQASRYFTSSMDSSDGLSTVLDTMATQSKKKFLITKIPAKKEIRDIAKTEKQLINLVFHGGEEYEFAFTIKPKFREKIKDIAKLSHTPIIEIGRVESGRGVQLEQGMVLKDLGWKHFV